MTVEMRWEEPLAGHLVERYHIDADTLNVESKVVVRGSSASARLVSHIHSTATAPQAWASRLNFTEFVFGAS